MIKNNGCCDLKLAKKLHELKVKQKSLWFWIVEKGHTFLQHKDNLFMIYNDHLEEYHSAFTVAELGEMLKGKTSFPFWTKTFNGWFYSNENADIPNDGCTTISEDTEANARAKMLIWLIEQEIVKI